MPRFSANISMLFAERDWLDRPAAAAAAGPQTSQQAKPKTTTLP